MRSLWLGILTCAAMLVACGDDDSDFATRPSGGSSPSLCKDCDDGSSSSKKQGDGGSDAALTSSSAKASSSDTPQSSDSSKDPEPVEGSSSSSVKSSSSLVTLATPCKTDSTDTCEYGELMDDRDGQTYKTVKIGDQWWMAQNLNYETDSSFCYKDKEIYCTKYGRLYYWASAVDKSEDECGYAHRCSLPPGNIQGVCPSGWHLPKKPEWETLLSAVGGRLTAAKVLRSSISESRDWIGTDAFGFSVLPAGHGRWWSASERVYYEGVTHFWISTEYSTTNALDIDFNSDLDSAVFEDYAKFFLLSVRCIKDNPLNVCEDCDDGSISRLAIVATPCKTDSTDTCEYGELVDDRDGHAYKTVKIGGQVWMTENLNYASLQPTDELDSSSRCYKDSPKYCEKYGRLYLWSAAMDSAGTWSSSGKGCGYKENCSPTSFVRGVCPSGWHLPSVTEWEILVEAVGGQTVANEVLKSQRGWQNKKNGTDLYSFSVLPVGIASTAAYGEEGERSDFWSSTTENGKSASVMPFSYVESNTAGCARCYLRHIDTGWSSVRCVKD